MDEKRTEYDGEGRPIEPAASSEMETKPEEPAPAVTTPTKPKEPVRILLGKLDGGRGSTTIKGVSITKIKSDAAKGHGRGQLHIESDGDVYWVLDEIAQ